MSKKSIPATTEDLYELARMTQDQFNFLHGEMAEGFQKLKQGFQNLKNGQERILKPSWASGSGSAPRQASCF